MLSLYPYYGNRPLPPAVGFGVRTLQVVDMLQLPDAGWVVFNWQATASTV
jgi:hypothetical protein